MGEQIPFEREMPAVYLVVQRVIRLESHSLTCGLLVREAALAWALADGFALALRLKAIGTFKLNMQSYLSEALNGSLLDY